MDREQAKQEIRRSWRTLITGLADPAKVKVNRGTSYICPICGHGTHGDGLTHNPKSADGNGLKCFGCGFSGDIIELYEKQKGWDYNETLQQLAGQLNITIDKYDPTKEAPIKKADAPQAPAEDFTSYYAETQGNRSDKVAQEYLKSRGISEETAARYGLGYDAKYKTFNKNAEGKSSPAVWQALIIPTGKSSFIVRNTAKDPGDKNRYRKKGTSILFNSKALYNSDRPVYITEGELDALSIMEAGGVAVGLGSTSNYTQLVAMIEKQTPAQPLILALDADERGREAEETLAAELERLQLSFYRYNPYGTAKDASEALTTDKEAFIAEIKAGEHAKEAELEAIKEATREEYEKTSAAHSISDFIGGISERANTPAISTGFNNIDALLDGGLYEGLYIVGAVSSLGKTTFILQIADNLADSGQDVIIFSLEMAKTELIAKSISRLTFLNADKKADAKTTRGITAGERYDHYSQTEKDIINRSLEQYKGTASHIYIHEGVGDVGADKIREEVVKHISITGRKPVVIIDYLQILAPYDLRASDKQNTDRAILELKRISRDYKIPVLGVSSFNRENYTAPVNLASFKESGAIEYGSDVLIGLQYSGMDYTEEDKDEKARRKRIQQLIKDAEAKGRSGEAQQIQVKVLKHRNGSRGAAVLDFYPMFNYFCEIEEEWKPAEKSTAELFKNVPMK